MDEPLVEVPTATPTEKEIRIGNFIAEHIPDGATLQIGVGGIPNAVIRALEGHKHLGLHTEAMTDGVLPLLEKGIIDNSQKKIYPGQSIASLALGSRRLYDFMNYNKDIVFKDVAWTNNPFIIAQNPKVMSINSCLEIDLTGQVCADSIGTRIFSSVGGQHDFVYGSSQSEGGLSFLAMLATTNKGQNKIKPVLTPGAGVVTFPNQLRRNRIRMRQPPGTKPRGTRQADDFRGRAGIPRRAGTRRSRTLRLLVPQTPIMTKCSGRD